MLLPMSRRRLPGIAVAQIKELIESGKLRPGDKLPTERELTQQFKVGRGSVREALRALEALGLIDVRPGLGTFVRNLTDADQERGEYLSFQGDIRDLLEIRTILETKACVLAAQRCTEEDIGVMESAINEMQDALDAGDIARLVLADTAFHHAITRATRNKLLVRLEAALAHQLMDCRRVNLSIQGVPASSIERHRLIMQAIKSRDGDWAAGVMLDHIRAVESRMRARSVDRQPLGSPE